jgi:hypothetical protein
MSSLREIYAVEQGKYSARKAEITQARAALDEEERRLDMNLARLGEVVRANTLAEVPKPRSSDSRGTIHHDVRSDRDRADQT